MTGIRLNSLSAYRLCKIGVEGFDDIVLVVVAFYVIRRWNFLFI